MIAMEMAQNLREPSDILETYGMTKEEFAVVGRSPRFRNLYREHRIAWTSDGNTTERTKFRAQMSIEESLPRMHRMANDDNLNPNINLGYTRMIADLAGYNDKKRSAADEKPSADPFVVNIIVPMDDGSERMTTVTASPVIEHE